MGNSPCKESLATIPDLVISEILQRLPLKDLVQAKLLSEKVYLVQKHVQKKTFGKSD